LLLARIDGKSPVEYLTADKEKDFVRSAAKSLFADRIMRLDEIRETWRDAF
jgi:hypothetical protein